MNRVDPMGHMEQDAGREGGLTPEERRNTCDPDPTTIGGCSGPLCGATELDMGTIPVHVDYVQNDDTCTDFSTLGEGDFTIGNTPGLVTTMNGIDVVNNILGLAYWISPGVNSNVAGQVYVRGAGGEGIIVVGVGINNQSSNAVQITIVRLKVGDGRWQTLGSNGSGIYSPSYGTANPKTSTVREVKSPTIYSGRNFSVTISISTVNSEVFMSGFNQGTWYYSR